MGVIESTLGATDALLEVAVMLLLQDDSIIRELDDTVVVTLDATVAVRLDDANVGLHDDPVVVALDIAIVGLPVVSVEVLFSRLSSFSDSTSLSLDDLTKHSANEAIEHSAWSREEQIKKLIR